MKILENNDKNIRLVAESLKAGFLAAFPTETVYGLGGDAFNPLALAKIFEVKARPRFDPLIIHIAGLDWLDRISDRSKLTAAQREKLDALCKNLWPGPLTLILPKQESVPNLAVSGLPSAAVRFPSHPVAQKLIQYAETPIAAPSANPFGYLSPTRADHVAEQLGDRVDFIIDGGRTEVGVESTVLDISEEPMRILRAGGTPRESIEALIGRVETGVKASEASLPHSPGQLKSHYAPKIPLILLENIAGIPFEKDAAYLFFDGESRARSGVKTSAVWTLSEKGDLAEASANLFDILHDIDKTKARAIYAQKTPDKGLGAAINDRLSRASFVENKNGKQ